MSTTILELHLDASDGYNIGQVTITPTGGWGDDWQKFSCNITGVTGVHSLYIVAKNTMTGNRLCDLDWFVFE
jgi:hypothetical protein